MAEEQNRITSEILQKAVAKEFSVDPKTVEIICFDVSPGAEVGANFATVVKLVSFKYKLNGDEASHSYIYKEVPYSELREKLVRGSPIWKNEVVFYDTLVNKFQEIRRSIGKEDLPFPKCFYASDEDGVIVLENLKPKGFKTVPKSAEGIPEERLVRVLKEIGHFHATTYHYIQQYPEGAEGLKKENPNLFLSSFYDIFGGSDESMRKMFKDSQAGFLKNTGKILQEYSKDIGPDLNVRLIKLQTDAWKRMEEAQTPRSDFQVILHGDLWYSNFMFSDNEDGTCKDIMLIDMQIMRVTNPSVDLVYLLYSSSNNDTRKEHLETWLQVYHETLMEDLKALGYPESVYPFDELKKDIDHGRLFGVIMSLMHCQVVLQVISKEDFDLDALTEENHAEIIKNAEKNFVKKALKNDGLCKRLMGIVLDAKENNLL